MISEIKTEIKTEDNIFVQNKSKPKLYGTFKQAAENLLTANPLLIESRYSLQAEKLLIRLCFELQRLQGGKSFFLSCVDAGTIVGLSKAAADEKLLLLVSDGVLEIVSTHEHLNARWYKCIA